jgi:hypothetical protein
MVIIDPAAPRLAPSAKQERAFDKPENEAFTQFPSDGPVHNRPWRLGDRLVDK